MFFYPFVIFTRFGQFYPLMLFLPIYDIFTRLGHILPP